MECGRECSITHNTAKNGDRIEADLHHGKEHPRVFLHFQDALGIEIAIIGEQFKFNFTGCGQRDF